MCIRDSCGPEAPAAGLKGPRPARASVARPLYLKLLTRHTRKPGTRQAKMLHMRQTKSNTYHSIICTEKSPVQDVTPREDPPPNTGAIINVVIACLHPYRRQKGNFSKEGFGSDY